jgi:hypothetical protein
MLELIVGVLLAAGGTYFVLLPILRPSTTVDATAESAVIDEGEDPEDDVSPQTVALRALKEIEFDRATGKLSDSDYNELKAKYTNEALVAMRGTAPESAVRGTREPPARAPLTAHRALCPVHGKRPEPDAIFCSECGRRLGSAPAYCSRCGSSLESDARYCNRCGARVAA